MDLASTGDMAAFDELFRRHHARGLKRAAQVLIAFNDALDPKDAAKDVMQEVWVALMRRGLRPTDSFIGLFNKHVHSLAINAGREHRFITMGFIQRPDQKKKQTRTTSFFPNQIFGCELKDACTQLTLRDVED